MVEISALKHFQFVRMSGVNKSENNLSNESSETSELGVDWRLGFDKSVEKAIRSHAQIAH